MMMMMRKIKDLKQCRTRDMRLMTEYADEKYKKKEANVKV